MAGSAKKPPSPLPRHNPDFAGDDVKSREHLTPEMIRIEEIPDRTIRPGLQADGGDLEVLDFKDNVLTVRYEGACGSCPSARTATLEGITGILQHEYHPDIKVEAI
jgi:Fe-S cluster biogenesis protein NfuA